MHKRHPSSPILRLAAALVIATAVSLASSLGLRPAAAQGSANLLQNPGFEGDYAPFAGEASRLVAPGWLPWNVARKPGQPTWQNITPQYLPAANPNRVRSGSRAQELFEVFATFTAGVYQRVNVTPGTTLRFSAFLNAWSTEGEDPNTSANPSIVSMQVGIDPSGGTNGESTSIVWSGAQQFFDEYRELSVESTASASVVTVFVRAIVQNPVRHNNIYVDDAALVVTGEPPQPTPTPVVILPTSTPLPTLPPLATATNTPDFIPPTREGTITPGTPPPTVQFPSPTPEGPTPAPRSPTPTPDFPDLPGRVNYTVVRGDTVSGIAQRFNSRVDAIIALNNLPPDGRILVGQQLVIPVPIVIPTPVIPTPLPPTPVGGIAPVLNATLNGPTVNGIGTYIMQPGDTLEAVAQRYRTTVAYLVRLNGIVNPARIVIGQVLAVPGPGNNPPGGTRAPTIIPTQPGGGFPGGVRVHVVQPGENLFRISLRYNVTMAALMQANGIYNPNLIYVGQVLRIP